MDHGGGLVIIIKLGGRRFMRGRWVVAKFYIL